jgi:hypothetical protein
LNVSDGEWQERYPHSMALSTLLPGVSHSKPGFKGIRFNFLGLKAECLIGLR